MINIIKCDYVQWVDYAYRKIWGRVGWETDYVNLDPKEVFVQDGLMETQEHWRRQEQMAYTFFSDCVGNAQS